MVVATLAAARQFDHRAAANTRAAIVRHCNADEELIAVAQLLELIHQLPRGLLGWRRDKNRGPPRALSDTRISPLSHLLDDAGEHGPVERPALLSGEAFARQAAIFVDVIRKPCKI